MPLFLLAALGAAPHALADARRVAHVTTLLTGDLPAVMVGPDRAWVPTLTTQARLQLCAGERCAAIARVETCTVPHCPGTGAMVVAAHSVADVGDYPTDRDGYERERTALYSEPALAAITPLMQAHPQPAPTPTELRWVEREHNGLQWGFEGTLSAAFGFSDAEGRGLVGGEGRLGLRLRYDADDDDDELLMIFFGNELGPELAVHQLMIPDANAPGATFVGLGLASSISPRRWSVRVPSVYASWVPEVGVAVRGGLPTSVYFAWSLPFAMMVDPRVAVELRFSWIIVDDWVAGEDVAFIGMINLGVIAR